MAETSRRVVASISRARAASTAAASRAELDSAIASAVAEKVATLSGKGATPDPWLGEFESQYLKVKKSTHVSLAKLLLNFCAIPLAATNRYDEIQLIFYSMNSKASYMHDVNLAGFPINIKLGVGQQR